MRLHLRRPLLHQRLEVWHGRRVVHRLRLLVAVHLANAADPVVNGLCVLLCILDLVQLRGLAARGLGNRAQVQVQHGRIRLRSTRLVKHKEAKALIDTVWSGDLEKGINVANSWNVFWNKGLELCFELKHFRFKAERTTKSTGKMEWY